MAYRVPSCLIRSARKSKEDHSLAGTRTSGYFGDLKETGINPDLKVLQAKSGGRYLPWLLNIERLLKVQHGDHL